MICDSFLTVPGVFFFASNRHGNDFIPPLDFFVVPYYKSISTKARSALCRREVVPAAPRQGHGGRGEFFVHVTMTGIRKTTGSIFAFVGHGVREC